MTLSFVLGRVDPQSRHQRVGKVGDEIRHRVLDAASSL